MDMTPTQQAALQQLAAVPGVVGSMVFDRAGGLVTSAFPPVFDTAGLQRLAAQLSADGYFQEWTSGEQAALDLLYADGHVLLRSLDASWLLVLCTAQSNAQLLAMSLTQVVRRLRIPIGHAAPSRAATPAPAASPLDLLRAIVSTELGEHAAQALEILAAAGTKRKDLLRATSEVEKMVRLFISKKKAEEIAERMREILDA